MNTEKQNTAPVCQYCKKPLGLLSDSYREMCVDCSEYFNAATHPTVSEVDNHAPDKPQPTRRHFLKHVGYTAPIVEDAQSKSLEALDNYLENTPKEQVEAIISEVKSMNIEGLTVSEYFGAGEDAEADNPVYKYSNVLKAWKEKANFLEKENDRLKSELQSLKEKMEELKQGEK